MTPPATPPAHRSGGTATGSDASGRPRYGPIERCPNCRGTVLDTIAERDDLTFRCAVCATTWRYDLGHVLVTMPSLAPMPS